MTNNNPTTLQNNSMPLAARMRPTTIDQIVGQEHLFAPTKPLRVAYEQKHIHSMIFL